MLSLEKASDFQTSRPKQNRATSNNIKLWHFKVTEKGARLLFSPISIAVLGPKRASK